MSWYQDHVRIHPDFAAAVEKKVAEELERLDDYAMSSEEDDIEEPESPSGYSYCGCDTCRNREVMVLTTVLVLQGAQQGLVELIPQSSADPAWANHPSAGPPRLRSV
jgi:hypothetical protein